MRGRGGDVLFAPQPIRSSHAHTNERCVSSEGNSSNRSDDRGAGALSACISIPERAWRNGEAMTQSRAYSAVMSGNTSFKAARQLQSSLDPLRLNYREVAYPPFGQWW